VTFQSAKYEVKWAMLGYEYQKQVQGKVQMMVLASTRILRGLVQFLSVVGSTAFSDFTGQM